MQPKSLFIILLKIAGIYFLFQCLIDINSLLFGIVESISDPEGSSFLNLSLIIVAYALLVTFTYFLIFRPVAIINRLKLDKGFDEERLDICLDGSKLISIAVIIAGMVILLERIPNFILLLIRFFQSRIHPSVLVNDSQPLVLDVIYIMLGFICITQNASIARFIAKKQSVKEE